MLRINNYEVWLEMFHKTMTLGTVISPRGSEIRELENYSIAIDPIRPFMNFVNRNLKIEYIKKELLWKLGADKFDTSIEQHASMWKQMKNSDGSFNSNYGQYWFGQQMGFFKAFQELLLDRDSRRAVIPMLSNEHIGAGVNDTVCTESVGFRIRGNRLNMTVHMRSSDQVWGLGTDIPTFAFLQRLMLGVLQTYEPTLQFGTLTVTAMSSHIYSRHFKMVESILNDSKVAECDRMPVAMPQEAMLLASCRGKVDPSWGLLSAWLLQ